MTRFQRERELKDKDEEKIVGWQKETIKFLQRCGFDLSPADAVVIRDMVRQSWYDDEKMTGQLDGFDPPIEGIARWLFYRYGININEILSSHATFPIEWEELTKLIKKYREEQELI